MSNAGSIFPAVANVGGDGPGTGILGGTEIDPVANPGVMALMLNVQASANVDALARASGDVLLTESSAQALLVTGPGQWTEVADPGAGLVAQAIHTGEVGTVHVVTGFSYSLMAVNAQVGMTVRLYDGDLATGTIIWVGKVLSPTGQSRDGQVTGLNLVLSQGNDATLVFNAAPAVGNFQTLSLQGYTTAVA